MGNLLPVCLRGHHRRYAIVWSFSVRRNSIAFIDFHFVGIGPTLSFNKFRCMAPIILNWYHYVSGTNCGFVSFRIKIQFTYWKLWFLIWCSHVWLGKKTVQVAVLTIIVFLDDQVSDVIRSGSFVNWFRCVSISRADETESRIFEGTVNG